MITTERGGQEELSCTSEQTSLISETILGPQFAYILCKNELSGSLWERVGEIIRKNKQTRVRWGRGEQGWKQDKSSLWGLFKKNLKMVWYLFLMKTVYFLEYSNSSRCQENPVKVLFLKDYRKCLDKIFLQQSSRLLTCYLSFMVLDFLGHVDTPRASEDPHYGNHSVEL